MNIAVIGTGYVGLVSGVCFAEMGINVTCIDTDNVKIDNLKNGIIPIYEPGLKGLLEKNAEAGRIHFSTNLPSCIDNIEAIFLAVGTPPKEDGSADLQYIFNVARTIGQHINKFLVIVNKSTVPVGTAFKVKAVIEEELSKRGVDIEFDITSNPEFLKEGTAINDFMSPDRVIVGTNSVRAREVMDRIYKPFMLKNYRIIHMDIPSAEMTKYTANAMLATRISFINDIANLCDLVGADIDMIRKGIGADNRIGSKFLYPGVGYGGSCFPKDVSALIHTGNTLGYKMRILEAVEAVNYDQKKLLFNKLIHHFDGNIKGLKIAIWGLAFKPDTDDIREAPSLVLVDLINKAGGVVTAYDPVAMDECKKHNILVNYAKDMYEACIDASAIMLVTEWKEFRIPSWPTLARIMKSKVMFDGRNIYDKKELSENGFSYYRI